MSGAGDSIEQGKGGARSGSPDQCPAVHHSLLLNDGRFRSVMGKLPRVFPAISGSSRSVFAEIASAPSHAALYGGRSGNRWPDLVVAVSELRHSAMLRPRTRYAANSMTHAKPEDHRDGRHVRSGLCSTESAGFAAWPTSASRRNKLAANDLAFIQLASNQGLATR